MMSMMIMMNMVIMMIMMILMMILMVDRPYPCLVVPDGDGQWWSRRRGGEGD